MNIVSESGLYALILTSNKPEAKKFRKWVTAEVLPAIRRDGAYRLPHPEQAELEMKRAFAAALPEAQKAKAATKANAVRHFHKLIDDGCGKTSAVIEAASAAGIGERTLWQALSVTWFVAPSDYEIALAPRWRANPEREMLAECHPDAMIRWLQMKPHKAGVSEAYRRLLVEAGESGWFPIPSERTMRRTLHKLGMFKAKEVAHA